eukprot:TRINITY_DN12019_c0_g2_i1.p2 TRINITY_DN12019_c0_g2~~TRINITY_DN12019_c0_g2_i1.p2  ORF type:complete len:220 (+),score=5.84 TRINITY_DN12019_c0_g2_i1:22-681(+)
MRKEIETKVDLKYFKGRLKIEKDLTPEDSETRYTCIASHENTKYLLKRFSIPLQNMSFINHAVSNECLGQISKVHEGFFLMKAASCFSFHIIKPLHMDCAIDIKDKCMRLEIAFEYSGAVWSEREPINMKQACNLMRQLANAFLLIHNLGAKSLKVEPDDVVYNHSEDTFKFIGIEKYSSNADASVMNSRGKKKVTILEQETSKILGKLKDNSIMDRRL